MLVDPGIRAVVPPWGGVTAIDLVDLLDYDAVRARGREIIEKGYAILDKQLQGREWIAGPYSMADSAVFYVSFWGAKRMNMQLPANLAAHFERMLARPAVQRTLEQEGLPA